MVSRQLHVLRSRDIASDGGTLPGSGGGALVPRGRGRGAVVARPWAAPARGSHSSGRGTSTMPRHGGRVTGRLVAAVSQLELAFKTN